MDIHREGAGNSTVKQVEKPTVEKVQFSSGAYQDVWILVFFVILDLSLRCYSNTQGERPVSEALTPRYCA